MYWIIEERLIITIQYSFNKYLKLSNYFGHLMSHLIFNQKFLSFSFTGHLLTFNAAYPIIYIFLLAILKYFRVCCFVFQIHYYLHIFIQFNYPILYFPIISWLNYLYFIALFIFIFHIFVFNFFIVAQIQITYFLNDFINLLWFPLVQGL